MIDCGPGSSYKMYQMGVSPTEINHLFFTHLHSDHISDLPCLLMTRFDQSIATEPDLQLYGPPRRSGMWPSGCGARSAGCSGITWWRG